jgi:hypothetical protein
VHGIIASIAGRCSLRTWHTRAEVAGHAAGGALGRHRDVYNHVLCAVHCSVESVLRPPAAQHERVQMLCGNMRAPARALPHMHSAGVEHPLGHPWCVSWHLPAHAAPSTCITYFCRGASGCIPCQPCRHTPSRASRAWQGPAATGSSGLVAAALPRTPATAPAPAPARGPPAALPVPIAASALTWPVPVPATAAAALPVPAPAAPAAAVAAAAALAPPWGAVPVAAPAPAAAASFPPGRGGLSVALPVGRAAAAALAPTPAPTPAAATALAPGWGAAAALG